MVGEVLMVGGRGVGRTAILREMLAVIATSGYSVVERGITITSEPRPIILTCPERVPLINLYDKKGKPLPLPKSKYHK